MHPGSYLAVNFKYNTVYHRRKIKKEEKAKVAAVWGTELIQFLAALHIFHQDDFEGKDD